MRFASGGARARVVLTELPLESIAATGPLRFRLAKTLLFPRHAIPRRQVLERVAAVAAGLEKMAARRGVAIEPLPGAWYGLDPIHIRRRVRGEAWSKILATWRPEPGAATPTLGPGEPRAIRRARPEQWWLWGRPRSTLQPSASLPDGTTVSLY